MSNFKIFKQIKYVYFFYNFKTKLCNAVRTPFMKLNFKRLLNYKYNDKNDNIGALFKKKKIKFEILKKGDFKGEIGKFKFLFGKSKINVISIINHLIKKYNFKNYLEVGVSDGNTFNNVMINCKVGIDPYPSKECSSKNIFLMTSDEYFNYIEEKLESQKKFDIIFLDGLCLEEQMDKDINNALNHLNDNGIILFKNCNPPNKSHQKQNFLNNGLYTFWNGTTWKSYVKLKMTRNDLSMYVVNCEWGIGIIKKGKQKLYPMIKNLKYTDLDTNRENILNLISIYDFLTIF